MKKVFFTLILSSFILSCSGNKSESTKDLITSKNLEGLKSQKEDVGQTLGAYGVGSGCYFVLPILGPTTVRDSVGMIADTFVDPFAHVTLRENELLGASGNQLDYISVKGATAVDFRADNAVNFDSLEENSIDLYASYKSLYLQDRENKINNSSENEDDWGNLDN